MADLKDIHDFIILIEGKERGVFHPHPDIDKALDAAQMQVFTEYREYSRINKKLHNGLLPFKTGYNFSHATSALGLINFPADYVAPANSTDYVDVQTVTFDNTYGTRKADVRIVEQNELSNALQSQLRQPTVDYPIGIMQGGGTYQKGTVQIFPMVPFAGTLYYLRRPQKPNYVFTMAGRTETYDDVDSVQIEFTDTCIDKIIFKALSILGINLNDAQQVQYAEMKQKEAV
jgi:hypothetical protein